MPVGASGRRHFLDGVRGELTEKVAPSGTRIEWLILGLRVLGATELVVGILVFFFLIKTFSALETSVSQGGVTGGQFLIAFSVVFYHVVVGFLCVGISELLSGSPAPENDEKEPPH